jgi:hypothetical protein
MDTLDVKLRLTNLHCFEEGDSVGSAEPFLWTVFFKIDGDTTVVNDRNALQGTATVVGTPGNHRNLPNHDVDPGEDVAIPAVIGEFATRLRPIPLVVPIGETTEVGGAVGVITVLMEQDNTSNSAVAAGHRVLDRAVRDALNALIPTLNAGNQEVSEEQIEEMKERIGSAVKAAIEDQVSAGEWLRGFGNMDDEIGSEVFRFSHTELAERGIGGIPFQRRFRNHGDWELSGRIVARPVGVATGSLRVTITGLESSSVSPPPVRVTGPGGFNRLLARSTTLADLLPGTYQIRARLFTTGSGKPTCRTHTPDVELQQKAVIAGQTASVAVRYTSESCGDVDRPQRRS